MAAPNKNEEQDSDIQNLFNSINDNPKLTEEDTICMEGELTDSEIAAILKKNKEK